MFYAPEKGQQSYMPDINFFTKKFFFRKKQCVLTFPPYVAVVGSTITLKYWESVVPRNKWGAFSIRLILVFPNFLEVG